MSSNQPLQRLHTARVFWQLGRWNELIGTSGFAPPYGSDGTSSFNGVERAESTGCTESIELEVLQYQLVAALQLRDAPLALRFATQIESTGGSGADLARAVLSSAFSTLSRAWCLLGEDEDALRCASKSAQFYPALGSPDYTAELRYAEQLRALVASGVPLHRFQPKPTSDSLFIDCGGYDGCSVLQFLLDSPQFDCVSFEPNPELWSYFDDLPTTLVRKAAYIYDGEIDFTIDPVDFDGSSVIPGKVIDVDKKVANEDCPVLTVPCIDISAYVLEAAKRYRRIVLKLDVEGAEYDILEKMLRDGALDVVETLYCEFHYGKLDVSEERHSDVVSEASKVTCIREWDALPFSFSRRETRAARLKRRNRIVRAISRNRAQAAAHHFASAPNHAPNT